MSETLSKIRTAFLTSRKARDGETSAFLGTLIGEIESKAVMSDGVKTVSEDITIQTIKKFEKGNSELINIDPGNEKALREKAIISSFLPVQLGESELRQIIGALPDINVKQVMTYLKTNYNGLYDGKVAAQIVKELTSNE